MNEIMGKISRKIWYLWTQFHYKKFFSGIGKNTLIYKPLQLDESKSIVIENDVYIAQGAWLLGNNSSNNETLTIQSGCTIGHLVHIVAKSSVNIGNSVLIADKVFISDCTHNFQNIERPIKEQGISILRPVQIGNNSWIGENVCILGANIGKQCIIGSNAVVTKDIPDYSVAVGNPAKVIKKYNRGTNRWEKV